MDVRGNAFVVGDENVGKRYLIVTLWRCIRVKRHVRSLIIIPFLNKKSGIVP